MPVNAVPHTTNYAKFLEECFMLLHVLGSHVVMQEIELVGFLEKGLGKTHAKWSPVATAVYRLEPEFGVSSFL